MTTDAVLAIDPNTGYYDLSLDDKGDISNADFFDTALLYSIYGERRASPDEVVEPQQRRGWIGNSQGFENGSKLWLLSQSRLTRDVLNKTKDEVQKAVDWLVSDDLVVSIDDVIVNVSNGAVMLEIVIRRSRDKVDRKFFRLWENTGRAS